VAWPPSDAEAHRFVQQCAREALLPLLFASSPPRPVVDALAGWKAMDAANRQRTRTIENAIELLPSMIGEEFIYLKGADYSRRLYASPELRPQSDIDVLVPAHRFAGVAARLAQRFQTVYQAATHRSPRWPDRAYDLGGVTLELHHSFVQRSRARIDYDGVWQRRQPFMNAARVHDVDALLVSVINIAKDDLATTLLRYLDLWLMLRRDPSLFDAAAPRASGASRTRSTW
jgi:hypothetical protein